jgi:chemotaxis protein CheD
MQHPHRYVVVYTGEVATTTAGCVLVSSPLGSCVAVCAYDPSTLIGGLAHVMLPGTPPEKADSDKDRYAAHALETLISTMADQGANPAKLLVCLVGGANVLKREKDTIHHDNIRSLTGLIDKKKIPICCCSTGGYERMIARLDTRDGLVFHTIGDGPEKKLFDFHA